MCLVDDGLGFERCIRKPIQTKDILHKEEVKVEAKKEKSEFKFCIKCIGYAIVDVLVMFKGIIKKLA